MVSSLNPPFKSELFYAVQNEDYQSELAVLDALGKDSARVLIIASSGENTLSLLTRPQVAQVVAVDLSPAQVHLCQLRIAALETLSRDEQLRLFGADPSHPQAGDESARLDLYQRIRPHLPDASRAYWDERRHHEIAFGVQHVGRNDTLMHDVQEALTTAGLLHRPLEESDLEAWLDVYRAVMSVAHMSEVFGLPEPVMVRLATLAPNVGACHFRAIRQPDAELNYFVTTALRNRYATATGETGYPLYLQQEGQDALRGLGIRNRLHLEAGNMIQQMPTLVEQFGAFDLISISNIADWMSEEQITGIVQMALNALAPGGALLGRLAGSGRTLLADVIARHMATDDALNVRLPQIERAPWFRSITAGFKR